MKQFCTSTTISADLASGLMVPAALRRAHGAEPGGEAGGGGRGQEETAREIGRGA